jgi:hypothetical protein
MSAVKLSEGALKILRHLWDKRRRQGEYEYPSELAKLFSDPKDCEDFEAELAAAGLIDLGAAPLEHVPLKNRVRSAALTLDGERYITENKL